VIGESGKLVGDVIATSCDIWGTLQGKVIVREAFGMRKNAQFRECRLSEDIH
jgi:hypothetical protein